MLTDDRVDETGAEQTSAPGEAPRRPFWPVAVLLLGLLIALLGGAFLLDRLYRPQVGVEPAPTSMAAVQATAAPTVAAPATAPPAAPTATPAATTAATAAVAATATTVPSPSSAVTAGTTAVAAATKPAPTPPPALLTMLPTMERLTPLQKEVVEAYLRYWDVLARAQYDLDTSLLGEVLADVELTRSAEDVRRLRAAGHAAHVEVEHNFGLRRVTPDEATVYDEYVNRSILLDAVTKQPVSTKEPPPNVVKMSFEMKRIEGVWKIVDTVDHG
jgi:hypothetical protein